MKAPKSACREQSAVMAGPWRHETRQLRSAEIPAHELLQDDAAGKSSPCCVAMASESLLYANDAVRP